MKIENYLKLETKVRTKDYSKEWGAIDKVLFILSFVGNIASIFFASFFLLKILHSAAVIENEIVLWTITIGVLGSLELLKREIFEKFSIQFLRFKNVLAKEVLGLCGATCVLVFLSFYASLTGAHDFTSQDKAIETKTEAATDTITAGIKKEYEAKLLPLTTRNNDLFEENKRKEARKDETESNGAKKRIETEIDKNRKEIESNKAEIKTIETEMNAKIAESASKLTDKSKDAIAENSSNSFIFVVISTMIELLILIGIYFHNNYHFKSYEDYTDKINTSKKHRKWYIFYNFLHTINKQSMKGELIYSPEQLYEAVQLNGIITYFDEVEEFYRIITTLKIVNLIGTDYQLIQEPEKANSILKKHFDIE